MKPRIAVLGEFQTGKSTLVCCLLGRHAARVGEGLPTTLLPFLYRFDQADFVIGLPRKGNPFEGKVEDLAAGRLDERWKGASSGIVSLYNPLLQGVDLVDTPGLGHDKALEEVVLSVVEESDFPVLVMTKGFPAGRESFTSFVRSALADRRYGLLLNCGLECPADPRSEACVRIEKDLCNGLERLGLRPPAASHRVNLGRIYREVIAAPLDDLGRSKAAAKVLVDSGFDGLRETLVQLAKRSRRRADHTQPWSRA